MIVSADTLVYFGPLEDVVAAAADALRPGGRLIFTVEESIDAGDRMPGTPSARTAATATRAATSSACWPRRDLRPEIVPAELRLEAGDPVAGLVVRATKPTVQG